MARLIYFGKRLLQMIPVLFIIIVLIFVMVRLIPGDPARIMLGETAREEDVAALRIAMGLDKSMLEQFWIFFGNLLRLDFGRSLVYKMPCIQLMGDRLPLTMSLALCSTLLAALGGIPLGFLSGLNKDKANDQAVRIFSLAAVSMPRFWVSLLLMMLFGVHLRILPVGGWGSTFAEHCRALILPSVSLSMLPMALMLRDVRSSVVNINTLDYVDFAKSKGVGDGRIRLNYILRNSLISTVTILSTQICYMLGGSVITETIFALPGTGKLMVDAIFGRDYALLQCVVFFFALMVMVVNLLTDSLYSFIDPRITL